MYYNSFGPLKTQKILIQGPGFEAPFGENSRFTQLFKVRSCVTIECRPPPAQKAPKSQSTHRIKTSLP